MITIVDYGAGNLRSVINAVVRLGYQPKMTSSPGEVLDARAISAWLAPSVNSLPRGAPSWVSASGYRFYLPAPRKTAGMSASASFLVR